LGEPAHEVTVGTRGYEGDEPVLLEVPEKFDHREVARFLEGTARRGVDALAHIVIGGGAVVLHGPTGERGEDALHQDLHITVVALIVTCHDTAQPGAVLLEGSFPRLLGAERGVLLGHLGQPLQDESQLHGHRFLRPKSAVVVENGDPLLGRCIYRLHKGRNRVAGRGVVPRLEHVVQERASGSMAQRSYTAESPPMQRRLTAPSRFHQDRVEE
jgi:hypothetical protein